jgi:hypothetical protein
MKQTPTLVVPGVGAPAPPVVEMPDDELTKAASGVALPEDPEPSEPRIPPWRRMPRLIGWAAGGMALLLVGLFGLSLQQGEAEPQAQVTVTETVPPVPSDSKSAQAPRIATSVAPANNLRSTDAATPSEPPTAIAPPVSTPPRGEAPTPKSPPVKPQPVSRETPQPALVDLTAKQLYAIAPGVVPNVTPGLKFRVIQRLSSGEEVDVDPAKTFHSGDRVRFAFESNLDGYLYVAQAGSSGRWTILFPTPDANGGRNSISRMEQYFVPNNGWFAFDETPGAEEVFIILSREALDALPGFNRPVVRLESVEASVVTGVRQRLQSRDLVFEKDPPPPAGDRGTQASYVVSRDELARGITASVRLTHAR